MRLPFISILFRRWKALLEQGCRDAMRSHRSNLLCLFYREEDQAFEQSLFEKVAVATLWIKDDEKDVISLTKVIPVTSAPNQLVGSFYTEMGSALLDPLGFDHSSTFEAVQESLAELAEAEAKSNASPTIFIDLEILIKAIGLRYCSAVVAGRGYLSVAVFRSGVSPSKKLAHESKELQPICSGNAAFGTYRARAGITGRI